MAEVTSVSAFCTVASTQHIVIDTLAGQFANRGALITCLNTELGHSIKVLQGSHSLNQFGNNVGHFIKARLNKKIFFKKKNLT